jgi:hypothetical protein
LDRLTAVKIQFLIFFHFLEIIFIYSIDIQIFIKINMNALNPFMAINGKNYDAINAFKAIKGKNYDALNLFMAIMSKIYDAINAFIAS